MTTLATRPPGSPAPIPAKPPVASKAATPPTVAATPAKAPKPSAAPKAAVASPGLMTNRIDEKGMFLLGLDAEGNIQKLKPIRIYAAQAKEWLKYTKSEDGKTSNRVRRHPDVAKLVSTFLRNLWCNDVPSNIIFDDKGVNQQGQHRLAALVDAEEIRLSNPKQYAQEQGIRGPLYMEVYPVFGMPAHAADYIDGGKRRGTNDVAYRRHAFADYSIPTEEQGKTRKLRPAEESKLAGWLATAAKILFFRGWYGKKVRASGKFDLEDVAFMFDSYPAVYTSTFRVFSAWLKSVEQVTDATTGKTRNVALLGELVNPAYLVAAHFLLSCSADTDGCMSGTHDPECLKMADDFVKGLAESPRQDSGNPIYELHKFLTLTKTSQTAGTADELNRRFDAICLAMKRYKEGAKVTQKEFGKLGQKEFVYLGGFDQPWVEPSQEPAPSEEPSQDPEPIDANPSDPVEQQPE